VFAVDRKKLGSRFFNLRHEEITGTDQALLIGKRKTSARLESIEGRSQAGSTNNRADN